MINNFKHSLLVLIPVVVIGCTTAAISVTGPAVMSGSNPDAHAELEAMVSKILDGKNVSLSADVLTEKNTFFVGQKQVRSIGNDPLMGRRMDRPDHFTLTLESGVCTLTHDETGNAYVLEKAGCLLLEAEPSDSP
jgi:hypothetical protein